MVVSIDDILVHSKSKEEHVGHLCISLGILREKQLYARISKSEFRLSLVAFIGYMVYKERVMVDPHMIKAVKSWFHPSSIL